MDLLFFRAFIYSLLEEELAKNANEKKTKGLVAARGWGKGQMLQGVDMG